MQKGEGSSIITQTDLRQVNSIEYSKNKFNPIQKSFFEDDADNSAPNSTTFQITDAEKDDLLVSMMSLKSIKGIGFKTLCILFDSHFLQHFSRWDTQEIIKQWILLSDQLHINIDETVFADKQQLLEQGKQKIDELRNQHIDFIPKGHKSYPDQLLRLANPPRWLFVVGNKNVLQSGSVVAIVGTRSASMQGKKLAYTCASELVKRNVVVLSGLAKGIDESAHTGAVDYYGQSIAVLGYGLNASDGSMNNFLYEKIVELEGAVVSEYLPSDSPSRQSYLRRNELQVAFSRVVIPVECPMLESGTGATIRRALAIKTPVVGIFPNNNSEEQLYATKANLERLNIPVFSVMGGNSNEFWKFLEANIPGHRWSTDPTARQDRFLSNIERQSLLAKKKVDLSEEAIDRFAQRLKRKLLS
jgi:DNA protecting protein DprA